MSMQDLSAGFQTNHSCYRTNVLDLICISPIFHGTLEHNVGLGNLFFLVLETVAMPCFKPVTKLIQYTQQPLGLRLLSMQNNHNALNY